MKVPKPHSDHQNDRSPRWIYPNLINPDTLCHELAPSGYWIEQSLSGHAVVASFELAHLKTYITIKHTEMGHTIL